MIRTGSSLPLRSVLAVAAAVLLLFLGADLWSSSMQPTAPHLPHTTCAGDDHQCAGGFDHAHFTADSSLPDPGGVASAILPRPSTAWAALALIAVGFAMGAGLICASAVGAERGPPREVAALVTGRRIVTFLGTFRR